MGTFASFNPLHCGAVVASRSHSRCREGLPEVSIPFIAGQWSLPAAWRAVNTKSRCFNPLHCGAVVASPQLLPPRRTQLGVSIPFIAGQWSLLESLARLRARAEQFQSPSLRGSGRFLSLAWGVKVSTNKVSIPFIAGQWSLLARPIPPHGGGGKGFQSPSLRGSGRFGRPCRSPSLRTGSCFNPLHCGAVVASRSLRICPLPMGSFNPLHCGAVVASQQERSWVCLYRQVSIPFIAGQWSLLVYAVLYTLSSFCFNPLHCGAVVASSGRL